MLAENLKRIRIEQRYTREQLGKKANITATTIQLIENGTIDNPNLKTLLGLSQALKVSITKLIK